MVHAEAPTDSLYNTSNSDTTIVDGMTAVQRAAKIDEFFTERGNLPMVGYGLRMVTDADQYGIDWKIVPAIAYNESTAGLHACRGKDGSQTYNAFGYGGCTIKFKSYNQAIDTVSADIAGQIPSTSKYFANKSLGEIIDNYNPPAANPAYHKLVLWTMNKIAMIDVPSTVATASDANQLAINN